jgi:aspartate kinase
MKGIVPVITGFIAKDRDGSITTLGRGGSDLTASVVGTAIMADEVQLWKDVNGILTADPRLAPDAQSISHLSFVEAAELARFGAKVLHPASVWPAMCKDIPVRVKNYQDPAHPGTLIKAQTSQRKGAVVAIAHKSRQALIHITSHHTLGQFEFFGSVFQILNEFNLSADVVATTHNGLSVTLEEHSSLPSLQERLQQIATVTIEHSKAFVSLIGANGRSSEFFRTVLEALNSVGIAPQIISYGVSRGNATLVINDDELKRCVETLHRSFF